MSTPVSLRIDREVSQALGRAFDRIDAYQRDGYCTEEDVVTALSQGWGDGVVEAWNEYIGEAT